MTINVKPSYKYAKKEHKSYDYSNDSSDESQLEDYQKDSLKNKIRQMNTDKHRRFPLPKIKPKQQQQQTEANFYRSDSTNKTAIFQDIPNRYDLYNRAPNVNYIKEKYNLYSDWVKQNRRELNELNGSNPQLNWYHFQKSVYSDEQDCFKFLKNINPDESQIQNQKLNPIQDYRITAKDKMKKKYHSTMSFCSTDPNGKLQADTIEKNRSFSTELNELKPNGRANKFKQMAKNISTLETIRAAFFANIDKNHSEDKSKLSSRLGIDLNASDLVTNGILHKPSQLNGNSQQCLNKIVHFIDEKKPETASQSDGSRKNSEISPSSPTFESQVSKTSEQGAKKLPPINKRFSADFYACLDAEENSP